MPSHDVFTPNVEPLPCDPACLRGGEKDGHVGNLLRGTDSTQRDCRQDLLLQLRSDPSSLDRAGRNGVDGDAEPAEFGGRASRVAFEGQLAGKVGHLRRTAPSSVATDIHDSAPRSSALNMPLGKLSGQECVGAGVQGEDAIE